MKIPSIHLADVRRTFLKLSISHLAWGLNRPIMDTYSVPKRTSVMYACIATCQQSFSSLKVGSQVQSSQLVILITSDKPQLRHQMVNVMWPPEVMCMRQRGFDVIYNLPLRKSWESQDFLNDYWNSIMTMLETIRLVLMHPSIYLNRATWPITQKHRVWNEIDTLNTKKTKKRMLYIRLVSTFRSDDIWFANEMHAVNLLWWRRYMYAWLIVRLF